MIGLLLTIYILYSAISNPYQFIIVPIAILLLLISIILGIIISIKLKKWFLLIIIIILLTLPFLPIMTVNYCPKASAYTCIQDNSFVKTKTSPILKFISKMFFAYD